MIHTRFYILIIALHIAFLNSIASSQVAPIPIRPTVALVLSGGGALGLAHIGIIKVIEELGIPVDIVVGTSMGAVVGGFYAQGLNAAQLEKIAMTVAWSELLSEHVNSTEERYRGRIERADNFASLYFDSRGLLIPSSLLTGRKLLYLLDRSTISTPATVDFDSLPRRYRAVSVDIATGERIVFDHGSLADVMRASMGIPGVLSPHLIDNMYLVDGGIVDNLPISTARELGADLIIAVDLIGGNPFSPDDFDRRPFDAVQRTIDIMVRTNVLKQLPGADLVLTVNLSGYQITDFKDAEIIMTLGEKTARSNVAALESFRMLLGSRIESIATIMPIQPTVIEQVTIHGGQAGDRKQAYILFAPLIGKIPDLETIDQAVLVLESMGIYEYIRVRRTEDKLKTGLSVSLIRHKPAGHSLQLGVQYLSTYSYTTESFLVISPGIILRGLISDDSRLAIRLNILDSFAFEASFKQALGKNLFAELYFEASQKSKYYIDASAVDYVQKAGVVDLGLNFGTNLFKWMELSIGLHYQWTNFERLPVLLAGDDISHSLMGTAMFSMYRLDTPIFPAEGFGFQLDYDTTLPGGATSRIINLLKSEIIFVPKMNIPLTFSIWGKAGSDFSREADDSSAAPQNYKMDIKNRQFFAGPLQILESKGSHIAGLGLEMKYQIPLASLSIGFPTYILSQLSVSTILQNIADITNISMFSNWNAAIGIGTRINDGFGVSLRFGLLYGFIGGYHTFLALDIGSIGY